eukprot:tig00021762_g23479.t1
MEARLSPLCSAFRSSVVQHPRRERASRCTAERTAAAVRCRRPPVGASWRRRFRRSCRSLVAALLGQIELLHAGPAVVAVIKLFVFCLPYDDSDCEGPGAQAGSRSKISVACFLSRRGGTLTSGHARRRWGCRTGVSASRRLRGGSAPKPPATGSKVELKVLEPLPVVLHLVSRIDRADDDLDPRSRKPTSRFVKAALEVAREGPTADDVDPTERPGIGPQLAKGRLQQLGAQGKEEDGRAVSREMPRRRLKFQIWSSRREFGRASTSSSKASDPSGSVRACSTLDGSGAGERGPL